MTLLKMFVFKPTSKNVIRRTFSTQESQILFNTVNSAGVITLNRPKDFNCVTRPMLLKMISQMKEWEKARSLVIVKGAAGGKAFCAGGNLKDACSNINGPPLFQSQQNVIYLASIYKIPCVALMHGICMGTGLGIAMPGKYRIATERTVVAMPETKIGMSPGVGGTYFLPRLKSRVGYYLGLTGESLKGHDAVSAGLATHLVLSKHLDELEYRLSKCRNEIDIDFVLNQYAEINKDFSLKPHIKDIEACFSENTIEGVIQKLEKVDNDWSHKTLETLHRSCPGALKVTLRALDKGSRLELMRCLFMEYRYACKAAEYHDLKEGVRALLVDKDNNPKWNPKTLEDVTEEYVNSYFEPLPEDKELKLFV